MILAQVLLGLLSSSALVLAQSCQNYGLPQGSGCLCPPGFGGSDCSSPACGGTIFQGSSRPTTPPPGNLTSAGCSCQDGWAGLGCNVCTSHSACQSGYVSQNPTSGSGVTGSDVGQNDTMVCNSAPRVWAAGEMSCSVVVECYSSLSHLHEVKLIWVLESDVTIALPRCHHSQHHTNPLPHALPHAQSNLPPDIEHHRRTALLRRCRTVFLYCGFMRAVDHRYHPLHMGMSKPQVHVYSKRHFLRRGTFYEPDCDDQQARRHPYHHLRRQLHVFLWSNTSEVTVWAKRALTELVLFR